MRAWFRQLQPRLPRGDPSTAIFRRVNRDGSIGLPFAADGSDIYRIVKAAAARAGLNPKVFGGHSLRAGFVTQAKLNGMDNATIKSVTGHTLNDTVDQYDRRVFEHTQLAEQLLGRPSA